ncbi:MAG TPA: hypothetical protein ENI61_02320, partial [Ignavibacteria bacterium]|nr:hypothetical protein [Ignavibacteria bacterium]
MKISFRILLINFAIVAIILVSSAFAFYKVMYNVLSSQQSKYLLNSTNEFIYAYNGWIQNTEGEFRKIIKNEPGKIFTNEINNKRYLDFILETKNKNSQIIINKISKNDVHIPLKVLTIPGFIKENPFTLINTYQSPEGKYYYYGIVINETLLNRMSKKINADIALVWKNSPILFSKKSDNLKFSYILTKIYNQLASKKNFNIISKSTDSNDILATIYRPSELFDLNNSLRYLIFITPNETANLRTSLKYILLIIGFTGIILSLILTYIFTDKIRKQITLLSKATRRTKKEDFYNKIEIKSKDELGELACA